MKLSVGSCAVRGIDEVRAKNVLPFGQRAVVIETNVHALICVIKFALFFARGIFVSVHEN